ncbi:Tim44 domain-containing protein [Desulfocurvus sp. DL9XJH121]
MRSIVKICIVILLLAAVAALDASPAEARFGGGRSFGGSRSFSRGWSKPVSPLRQQGAFTGQQGMRSPSRFGGMGGLLGGLLAGSLLGSLFFGHPFGGVGMFDLLLIGGGIFLLMRLLGRGRAAAQHAGRTGGMSYGGGGPMDDQNTYRSGMADGWGGLGSQGGMADAAQGIDLPPGFDVDEFLKGAKLAFNRLQASWDARDMDDIAQFASKAVLDEVRSQAAQDPNPSRTEVLMVNARLLEAKQEGGVVLATVYFDALMREDRGGSTEQVREVWHFRNDGAQGHWILDGLQQLEN